jgi:hypothetical protein
VVISALEFAITICKARFSLVWRLKIGIAFSSPQSKKLHMPLQSEAPKRARPADCIVPPGVFRPLSLGLASLTNFAQVSRNPFLFFGQPNFVH